MTSTRPLPNPEPPCGKHGAYHENERCLIMAHFPDNNQPPAASDVPQAPPPTRPHTAVPSAFRVVCPHCGQDVVFPWDPIVSGKLDLLSILEQYHPEWLAIVTQEVAACSH